MTNLFLGFLLGMIFTIFMDDICTAIKNIFNGIKNTLTGGKNDGEQ